MLTMLQRRMKQVDPSTPQRRFLMRPEHQSAVSSRFGDELAALEAFEQAIETYVMAKRPVAADLALADPDPAEAMEAMGLLLALLITRLGLCSPALLGKAVQAVGCTPWVAGPWAWVDVDLSEPARGTAQLRRLFLDPITLAAWIRASQYEHLLPRPKDGLKAGKRASFYRTLARRAFRTLRRNLQASGGHLTICSLGDLCHAQAQRVHLITMPLLATYAQGNIASSSLDIGTWLRLIGYQAPAQPPSASDFEATGESEGENAADDDQTLVLDGIDPGGDTSLAEQIERGDLEEHGLVATLRMAMAGPRSTWREHLDALIDGLQAQGPEQETARLVVCWLRYLAFEREGKGHILEDGTVQNYRGMLGNRLLQCLPPQLSEVDAEELRMPTSTSS
jgi:hypothetical protein